MNQSECKECIETLYWNRDGNSIKSDYGKSLLIGGSSSYPNAVTIASLFASKSGNGYTAVSVPESVRSIVFSRISPLQISGPLSFDGDSISMEENGESVSGYDSVLFGNGMIPSEGNLRFLSLLLSHAKRNVILDAGALRMLSNCGSSVLKKHRKELNILLTPHLGEAKALFGLSFSSRNPMDYLEAARMYTKEYQVSVLLKSSKSLLVLPDGSCFPSEYPMTPILAKAGSGDALAGYLSGLLAYADEKIGYEKSILFADDIIHSTADQIGRAVSPGYGSVLDLIPAIGNRIRNVK